MSNYSEITLISDDEFSALHTSDNTPARFRTYFDHELSFDNSEVAIKKITFQNYFHNISSSNDMIYVALYPTYSMVDGIRMYGETGSRAVTERNIRHPTLQKFPLRHGQCEGVQELFQLIHDAGSEHISWWKGREGKILEEGAVYYRTKYELPKEVKLYVHGDLLKIMGYDNLIERAAEFSHLRQDDIPKTHYLLPDSDAFDGVSVRRSDMRRTKPTLHITSDIVRPTRCYGHTMRPLLLEKATANEHDTTCEYSPTHLSWLPLARNNFSSAEIYISDSSGKLVPFVYGPTIVELVIRERQYTHNQL